MRAAGCFSPSLRLYLVQQTTSRHRSMQSCVDIARTHSVIIRLVLLLCSLSIWLRTCVTMIPIGEVCNGFRWYDCVLLYRRPMVERIWQISRWIYSIHEWSARISTPIIVVHARVYDQHAFQYLSLHCSYLWRYILTLFTNRHIL